jgi:DNA-binding CsgD family transcriptional regulator
MDGAETTGVPPTRFVGRRTEVAALRRLIDDICRGRSRFVVMEAEAGAGKTTMLRRAAELAGDTGRLRVLAASGDPGDERALRCVAEALGCHGASADPDRARVAQLLRADAASAAPGAAAAQELLVDLIERAALSAPTLMIVDDLQWVDDASLGLLASLGRRLTGYPFGVLAATRPAARVRASLDGDVVEPLVLGPFGDDEVAEIVRLHTGDLPSPELVASLGSMRSSPMLITLVASHERTSRRPDGARPPGLPSHAGAVDAFRAAAADLDDDLRHFLELAAVEGRHIDVDALAAAAGIPVARALALVERAVGRSWLDADGEVVAFRHDLLVEALCSTLPFDRRDRLHLTLGRALARLGHAPGRAAYHLEAAGYLLTADDLPLVRPLLEHMPADDPAALSLARLAHDVSGGDDAAVATTLVRCLAAQHRHGEALEVAARWLVPPGATSGAAPGTGSGDWLQVLLAAVAPITLVEGSAAAIARLGEALASSRLGAVQRADALNALARVHWHQRDAALVHDAATRALDAARTAGAAGAEIVALCSRSEAASLLGDVTEALADAEAARALAAAEALDPTAPALALGTALAVAGRMREGLPILTTSLRAAEREGNAPAMVLAQVTMQATRFHIGEWDAFVADADAMTEIGRDTGTRTGVVLPLGFAAAVLVRRGQPGELPALAARLRAEHTLGDLHPGALVGMGLLELAELEAAGRVADACRYALAFAQMLAPAGASAQSLVVIDVARLAWQAGDREALEAVVELTGAAARRSQTETRARLARYVAALAAGEAGALADAARAVAQTERAWDGATALHLAGIVATATRLAAADDLLAEAAAGYLALGSTGHAAAARAGRGIETACSPPTPHTAVAAGRPAISAAERRVLRHVVDGLANADIADRLFVSKRTVESHLAALYRKLDVPTRVGLARIGATLLDPGAAATTAEPDPARHATR